MVDWARETPLIAGILLVLLGAVLVVVGATRDVDGRPTLMFFGIGILAAGGLLLDSQIRRKEK